MRVNREPSHHKHFSPELTGCQHKHLWHRQRSSCTSQGFPSSVKHGAVVLLLAMLAMFAQPAQSADIFTSLAELPKVLHAEYSLAEQLRNYVQAEQSRLNRLKELADEFEVHSTKALADPESYLGNPVGAFLLIKRFASDWKQVIERDIRSNTTEEFLYNISSKTNLFPDQADLDGAATALLRIQDTYALDTSKLATGDLQGVQDSPRMTAEDCYKLGWVAYNKQDYYHTVLWMDEALKAWDKETDKTIDRATLLDYLSYSVYVQGNVRRALNLTIEWLNLVTTDDARVNQQFFKRDQTSWKFHRGVEPSHIRAQNNKQYFEKTLREQEELHGPQPEDQPLKNPRQLLDYQGSSFFINYERLCRGEDIVDQPLKHKLKCYYRRHHPFFYIRPALEEVLSLKPHMYFYRNILSDEEIDRIKGMANSRLYRSVVYHKNGDADTTVQDYRISKSAWLKDVECPILRKVSNKASYIANLTLDTAEDLQVLNYGIGGHYEPHYDFATGREISTFEKAIGNRIATVICYLSDVTGGGATVFPDLGVKIFPEKGSCVLWYNLLRSGAGDMRTRHAACPVLTGIKWVVNKWFHERGQEFQHQCGLTPDIDN